MKSFCKIVASLGLLTIAAAGIDAADAMPVAAPAANPTTVSPQPEAARLVCNYRRCYRVGGYRYYRPYGYYRPYYYRPHIGVGIGGFGIGIY